MNVLVVGGAGYLGGAVVDLLLRTGHHPRVYDLLLYEESYRKPVDFSYGDVRDVERLRHEFVRADAVIWLAAIVGDRACDLDRDATISINEKSVAFLANNYHGRILFSSTCSVYGEQKDASLTETSALNPLSLYAATKIASETYLSKKNALIFRLGTLFGVGDTFSRVRLDLVVNTFTVQAFHRGRITVIGGEQFRPLLHVRDAAQAIVDSIASPITGIFNLHRQNVRIGDLAFQVRNHFPDLIIESIAMPATDARDYRVNSDKARSQLKFAPVHSIDAGIEDLKNILEANRLQPIDNPRYVNARHLAGVNNLSTVPNQFDVVGPSRGNGHGETIVLSEIANPSAKQNKPLAAA